MINGIGSAGLGRIGTTRADAAARDQLAPTEALTAVNAPNITDAPTSPVAVLAGQGAPIDQAKIAEIRQAIAEGRYPVDPKTIADKMIALDLPSRD